MPRGLTRSALSHRNSGHDSHCQMHCFVRAIPYLFRPIFWVDYRIGSTHSQSFFNIERWWNNNAKGIYLKVSGHPQRPISLIRRRAVINLMTHCRSFLFWRPYKIGSVAKRKNSLDILILPTLDIKRLSYKYKRHLRRYKLRLKPILILVVHGGLGSSSLIRVNAFKRADS